MANEPKSPLGKHMVKNGYPPESNQVQLADAYYVRANTPYAKEYRWAKAKIKELEAQLK